MGIQKDGKIITRYQTKYLSTSEFIDIVKQFFNCTTFNPKDLLIMVKEEINKLIKITEIFCEEYYNKFFSLLIIYDIENDKNCKLKIYLIDFSYYDENASIENKKEMKNDLIGSLVNFLNILKSI